MCRLLAFTVVLGLVFGCSKKKDDGGSPGGGEVRGVESDPNAAYTLKVRDVRRGDKTEARRYESRTETRQGGDSGTRKLERRLEYAEHILEMPDGAPLPTKLTRTYTVAQRTDLKSGQMQALPYQGKTVTTEKRGANYRFLVDGKPLPRDDAADLDAEFRAAGKVDIDALLPKQPVKVGEQWPVDRDVLWAFGDVSPDVDFSKSTLTAKLARAYTLDGKQWAQIAFDFDLVIDPNVTGGKVRGNEGTRKIAGTFDVVIDGSVRDSVVKGTVKGGLTSRHKASEVKSAIDGTFETTVRTAK